MPPTSRHSGGPRPSAVLPAGPAASPTAPQDSPAGAPGDASTDLADRLRLAVARLNRRLRQEGTDGVTPAQLTALLLLDRCGELPLAGLAERAMVSSPSMNRTLAQLAERGLVDRHPCVADGRVVLTTVTPAGRTEAMRARRRRDAWLAGRLAELGADRRAEVERAVTLLEALAPTPGGSVGRGSEARG